MQKVVLIGLGAVGLTYAVKLLTKCDLYILADEERIKRYQKSKPVFNGKEQDFEYILPSDKFIADLIIIATKSYGLNSAIKSIENFVGENTRIISLINGISSEEQIKNFYPQAKVLKSYFIGHSAVRVDNSVNQDGVGEIVIEKDDFIHDFFTKTGINFSMPEDINYSMWLKYTFNCYANPLSAILNMTFGELRQNVSFIDFAKKIINEVCLIAEKEGVKYIEKLQIDALEALNKMCEEGKTSMLQDVLAGRKTEVDIFSGEIIKLGKKYNVQTPYNQALYDLIKIKEENNEHSIHTR